jgi:hypothetical protein
MERQPRNPYTGEQIIGLLKRHLVEGVPISDVCEQAGAAQGEEMTPTRSAEGDETGNRDA